MSQMALLKAVRDRLREAVPEGLGYAAGECEVMFDGHPPPGCGQVFVAVHAGDWDADPETEGLDERYGIDITVTIRVARIPQSTQGAYSLIGGETGNVLDEHLEQIRAFIHRNYDVNDDANATIGVSDNGFVEALRFAGASPPRPCGADWFSAEATSAHPPVGVCQTLHFVDANRVQVIEEQS